MLKMYTAHTQELDDLQLVTEEIIKQIDLSKLLKNTIGIVTFHYDFAKSGVVEELKKKLPFEIIGMTTMAGAHTSGYFETYSLYLTVLTSDDVEFSTAMTKPLTNTDYKQPIADAYNTARAKFNKDPKFILTFAPVMTNLSGADITLALDTATGGIPCWGSLASGVGMVYDECRILYQDQIEQHAMSIILIYGNVEPEFIYTSIPQKNMRDIAVIVTESDGCVVKKVNDIPFLDYLKQLNIELNNENCTTLPFMVYSEGMSEPISIGIYRIYDDSSVLFGTHLKVGTKLVMGQIDQKGILETAQKNVEQIIATGKKNGALFFPCVTRSMMLVPDQNAELKLITKLMAEKGIPYLVAYAGGEICPVRDDSGTLRNRFHNYSFSSVVF
ncbi:MAG: FIST C-terminal domain-containing protein [Elusimicrobia bacterium]|nr:FIST C-terminal domain-containing protein [Elusimicrobiota bacterium]